MFVKPKNDKKSLMINIIQIKKKELCLYLLWVSREMYIV